MALIIDDQIQLLISDQQFTRLIPYFDGVKMENLRLLTEQDLVEICAPKDRLLMKIFVRDRLSKFLHGNDFHEEEESSTTGVSRLQNFDLDLSLRICSEAGADIFPTRLTLKQYIEGDAFKQLKHNEVRTISIARCALTDSDMPMVVNLLDHFPSCIFLDLSDNRLHGIRQDARKLVDEALFSLMKRKVRVNICGNPFATVDRLDFFQSSVMTPELFGYLLFVPKFWVERAGWYVLIQGRQDFNVLATKISDTHFAFFSRGELQPVQNQQ